MTRRQLVPTWLLCVVALGLQGCGSTRVYDEGYQKNYAVNVERFAPTGAPMVSRERIKYVEEKKWVGLLNSSDGWQRTKYATDDSFKEELIYSGKSADTIRISYREFKKDFARPAFYQELTYDALSADNVVFRNFRIQILDANNEGIRFKVLAD